MDIIKQVRFYEGIDREALNPIYKEILTALDEDEVQLMKIFRYMSGQQINLPVHLYNTEGMKRILKNKYQEDTNIDVNREAKRYGYTRRWILNIIKRIEAGEI